MSYNSQAVNATAPLNLGWFQQMAESFKQARARRRVYAETFSELSAMSDRELEDLGLSRLMVRDIALEAADKAVSA